jgi:hypothetical protein
MYLNIIKTTYEKPIVNIILNGEKLKPLNQEQDRVSILLLASVLEYLARPVRQEKTQKGFKQGKKPHDPYLLMI